MNTHRYKGIVSGLLTALLLLSAGCSSDTTAGNDADAAAGALTPKPLAVNDVGQNPYLSSGDALVHNDSYSSDVTDTVMPLAIDEVVSTTLETKNKQAPPSMFFDNDGNAITPFLGGIAVTDLTGDTITRQATFVPAQDDGGGYSLQISYAFVDKDGRVVAPTSDGRVIMLETKDADGNVYEKARKVFDVDIVSAAVEALGEDIDQNLLSIIYDYDLVTYGFVNLADFRHASSRPQPCRIHRPICRGLRSTLLLPVRRRRLRETSSLNASPKAKAPKMASLPTKTAPSFSRTWPATCSAPMTA